RGGGGGRRPPPPARRGGAPAESWRLDGSAHTVGVIASVTAPFCGACDRVRLTADGQMRNCLFSNSEFDLVPILRGGGSDADIEDLLRRCIWKKLPGHAINDPSFLQPARGMNAIGG
ncbi:MAG: GTP 3',8-cyclase MoaA, partial [Microbacterium gubbeenense]